jgi:Protein of unknown function (DUF3072)
LPRYDRRYVHQRCRPAHPREGPRGLGDRRRAGPQLSYLGTLAQQAGEDVPQDLTKAQASKLIDELRTRTGRGETKAG